MKDTKLRDILDYEFLSSLDISDDYRKISYKKTKGNYKENRYDSNLWIYDTETCENYQISDDNKASISTFNKDSNIVYKKESSDESDVFYVKDGTGLGHKYFSIDKDVDMIKHLGDDIFLLKAKDKLGKEEKEKDKEDSYFEEIDKLPFYLNGAGFIKDRDSALYFMIEKMISFD